MNIEEDILWIKDKVIEIVEENYKKYQIVTLKINVPGEKKNIRAACPLFCLFDKRIFEFKPILRGIIEGGEAGTVYYYFFPLDKCLKPDMMDLEESGLGRFVDIDVYYNDTKSISRDVLRRCYFCDRPAFACQRMGTHPRGQLIRFIDNTTYAHIRDIVKRQIKASVLEELELEPKFGLVTKNSNGSHPDMNSKLMEDSLDAILPYFLEMFRKGYYCSYLEGLFPQLREIGKKAETAMFEATGGINTYKGLIFNLGIIVGVFGYKISHEIIESIFDLVEIITKGLCDELKKGPVDTFGKEAYRRYGITGIRGEVENGFNHVQTILNTNNLETYEDKMNALMFLIGIVDDTVLLKRCGSIEKYNEIRNLFIISKYDDQFVNEFTKTCIENNYSFGGSADLLIVCLFIKKINELFKFR